MSNKKYGWKATVLFLVMLVWMCGMSAFAEGASDDNSLSSLGITTEGAEVSPEFGYGTVEYNVRVPAGTARLELEPVPTNGNAWIVDITGQDLTDGKTTVQIVVSAENGDQYSYYLYVEEDAALGSAAPAAQTEPETEPETQKATEPETEPETEDPRYVKVDRNSLEEAENTIQALKTEAGNYRDRIGVLMKILYGLIGFCVILLFVVINLLLKKKDLKSELQKYMGYGYPENYEESYDGGSAEMYENGAGSDYGYDQGYDQGYDRGYDQNYADDYDQSDDRVYDQQPEGYEGPDYGYENIPEEYEQNIAKQEDAPKKPSRERKSRKSKDDPATVPKPREARKKAKQMPQYQKPQPEYSYEPKENPSSDHVEINMIDL